MRKELIELLRSDMNVLKAAGTSATATLRLADNLIANGVTVATDNSVAYKSKATEPLTNCQQWIPVSERLPDEFEQLLCIVIRPIRGGKYVREYRVLWCDYDHSWNCDELIVTHWMPLPEPPKGE